MSSSAMENLDFVFKATLAVAGMICGLAVILSHSKAGRDAARTFPKASIIFAMIGAVVIYTSGYYNLLWFVPNKWGTWDDGDFTSLRVTLALFAAAPSGLVTINILWLQDEIEIVHQNRIKRLQDDINSLTAENREISDEGYKDWREAVRLREEVDELKAKLSSRAEKAE